MNFLADNWFFILIAIAFLFMMSRHGGCGMHGQHGSHRHAADQSSVPEEEETHAHHH